MRITTQMMNNAAKKTGIPMTQNSLLNYINKEGNSSDSLLSALQSQQSKAASTANQSKYEKQAQAAQELTEQRGTELSVIGISVNDDGSLSADTQKLSAASRENLEKALGADSEFVQHLSYLSQRIGDNAEANLESITSGYLANGTLTDNYTSKYDFLG